MPSQSHCLIRFGLFTALLAASAFVASGAQGQAARKRPGVTDASVRIPIERLKPDQVFDVPGAPDWIAIDEDVWISNEPDDTVMRIDPRANKAVGPIKAGKAPCSGLAAGFGSLWVPLCGDSTLGRVDLKSGKVVAATPMTVGDSEGGIAVGAGSVWLMTDAKGTLARIDPATGKAVAEIAVAPGSFGLAFGDDAVWVTSSEKNLLIRVNAFTNVVEQAIAVGPGPRFLTFGEGGVWTLNQSDGSITRVDPKTNKVVATIRAGIPGRGGEISAGEGSVWATSFEFPITRIDPATNTVAQQFFGPGGDAIRAGRGSVWLSNLRQGNVWRLDPKRIEATVN
jgi:virginiamycin B lyase